MENNFLNLFKSNTGLRLDDLNTMVLGIDYLTFDELFTSAKIVPADLQSILNKYGSFWIHLDKTKQDYVVHDVTVEMDEKSSQLSYWDASSGKIEQNNFTDFLQLVSESTSDASKAMIRLIESPTEGRSSLPIDALFPGFPLAPSSSIAFPTLALPEVPFEDIYRDFLYNPAYSSFPQYYFQYLNGITDLTHEEKATRFIAALKRFVTPQSQGPIPIYCNCIVTSKMQIFKLIGLVPIDFEVADPPDLYPPDVSTFVKKSTGLTMYNFAYGLGLSGLTDAFLPFLKKMGYDVTTDNVSKRIAFVTNFMNKKIIKKLIPFSPRRKRKISLKMISIADDNVTKMHDFIVKIKDVNNLNPFAFQLDLGIPHFVAMVYNPFSENIEIIDPFRRDVISQGIIDTSGVLSLDPNSSYSFYKTHRLYVFSELN